VKRSLRKTLFELAGGSLVGTLFLAAGSWIGATLGKGASGGWGDVIGALFGSLLACPIGFILGMWLVALRLHVPHSVLKAAAGAILGVFAVMLLAEPFRLNQDSRLLGVLLYLVPCALALIGFNLPRRDQGSRGR